VLGPGRGAALLVCVLFPSCSLDDLPSNPTVLVAPYLPDTVRTPQGSVARLALIDGVASDPEWNELQYTHIAVGPEHGNSGGSFTVSAKMVHDRVRVYLLLQWPDPTPDDLGPRLRWAPDPNVPPSTCDSLLLNCSWELVRNDEDRIALMWDLDDARDNSGRFRDLGCQVACHGNMHPLSGSVDIWQWRAARTNAQQMRFDFPSGAVNLGFADDGYASGGGRVADPGLPLFRDNYRMTRYCGTERPVPLKVADAYDESQQRPSSADNDNLSPCLYISDRRGIRYQPCPRTNPCRLFNSDNVLDFTPGDDLPGLLVDWPHTPNEVASRHDVLARGRWEEGVWTVEMVRPLVLLHTEDVSFHVSQGSPYFMALAVMNNTGRIHAGSPVIEVRFEP
jgi:hypothetical protein